MAKAKVIKKALANDPVLTKKVIKQARKLAMLASETGLFDLQQSGVLNASLSKTLDKLNGEGNRLAEMLRGPTDEE